MRIYKIIASGLGTGYAPIAPGTAGSVLGILIIYLVNNALRYINSLSSIVSVLNLLAIIIVLLLGVYSTKKVHTVWAHDDGRIVIDEIVGVWIAVLTIPFKWEYYLSALILFRFFDIAKPFLIRKIDQLKNDWAVMLDDVLAGIYANLVLQLIIYFGVF